MGMTGQNQSIVSSQSTNAKDNNSKKGDHETYKRA